MNDLTLFGETAADHTTAEDRPATAPVVHGAVLISAVETAWKEIRRRFASVPDVSVTTPPTAGAQDPTTCSALRTGRHFDRDGTLTIELQVTSGTLGHGGRPMMEGLLHHAAHGLALARGITDISGGDQRWHNKQYGRLAREVGLTLPARASRRVGRGHCSLSDAEAAKWAEVIAALDAAAAVQLQATVQATAPPRSDRNGTRFLIICECTPPRRQQVTPFFFDQGPLLCGVCLTKFRPTDTPLPHQADRQRTTGSPGRTP
ncbi:hypothetical protein OG883_41545 [Streptomyces sp. NBC_01142]|uniref:hypothetical protein n=1 Tax=Streptomyces sp. NBC_01142 TaxID=2975865 RepID=UPI00225B5882|nr:hypothetical protein [Streptomyces sp. NBC_01142]MCX4826158.1 hypothetical protein [Streptomyces sp. NBC_01142]